MPIQQYSEHWEEEIEVSKLHCTDPNTSVFHPLTVDLPEKSS